ncbi:MAG: c-type cytochrome [Candidatus Omnitrophota bacterium]
MPKENPTLYSIPKTFMWFAVTSILLTAGLVAIVLMDHSREWKVWQKKFIALKLEKAKAELAQADQKIDKPKLESLKKGLKDAEAAFRSHRKEYDALQKETGRIDTRIAKTRARHQDLKQFQDSYKYFYEEHALRKDPKAAVYAKKLKDLEPKLAQAKLELENLERERETKGKLADQFLEKEKTLTKDLDKLLEEKLRLQKQVETLKPGIATEVLNAPMVDFMAPTLKVQQVVLEDLYDDYHFTKVQKVDRCMTCHLGIDQKGFEDAPQPFRTHPKMELYLGANSPHPIEKFGCTTCHGGSGHSVSFKDSAHTPQNEAQKKEWRKKYGWQELEKWEAKMLPLNHIEAACAKCHTNVVEVPQAAKLNRGGKIAETSGCFNCHKVAGFENRWKTGPDLQNIKSKLDEDWVIRWLHDPTAFRSSTRMPRIFHLSNVTDPEDRERDNAAIQSIAAYLMKHSEEVTLSKAPVPGDRARGEKLVKTVGCTGCHTAAGVQANDHGPELSGLGSKVTPDWLYTWLKDPKHFSKDTRMPSLRLTDQEAADITSYLLSQRNEAFDRQAAPAAKPEAVNELILTHLQGTMRQTEAQEALARMGPEERLEFLGKKSIAHQGCYSCHAIKGFENAKPIGTELTHEGSKDIHQFDFGFVHGIDHTRHAWLVQKFREPRIFDEGKVKGYYEKLRMPQFNFTDEDIDALTTFMLSLTEEAVPLEMQKTQATRELQIEKGRLLASKMNCAGCHTLDGKTGGLWEQAEDKGAAPPVLDGEGAKVQEKWLHAFLKDPVTIRPWLATRMPTFGFSEEELTTLVQYFAGLAHEEVSYQGYPVPATTPEKLQTGKMLFDRFQCAKCHQVSPETAAMGASFLAPEITLTKHRLKPEWVKKWLEDPQALQEGTMMPGFFPDGQSPLPDVLGGDAHQQIEAIRDYLYTYEPTTSEKEK